MQCQKWSMLSYCDNLFHIYAYSCIGWECMTAVNWTFEITNFMHSAFESYEFTSIEFTENSRITVKHYSTLHIKFRAYTSIICGYICILIYVCIYHTRNSRWPSVIFQLFPFTQFHWNFYNEWRIRGFNIL